MAHFAKISEENVVLQVLTLADKDCKDEEGTETESIGQAYLEQHNNWPAHLWIKTSYNTRGNQYYSTNEEGLSVLSDDQSKAFRGNYAGISFIWDATNQIFWEPQPYGSWVKNTSTAKWESPLGDPPALTAEQEAENKILFDAEKCPKWYEWSESAHQADNTQGWVFVDENTVL